MEILIVGCGGREHALGWKLSQSEKVKSIFFAPGNAGTALVGQNIALTAVGDILRWLEGHSVDMVVIGPDDYLAQGLSDDIQALGILTFGPTKAAAEIEWSKSFAKELMREENIPTARFQAFTSYDESMRYASAQAFPLVIKADGLASGKGVVIARNLVEAEKALKNMLVDNLFGDAGTEVLIEEYLSGREISIHAFCDGERVSLFPASQDHKRIYDDDQGPNTGGMGTIAPVPWVTEDLLNEVRDRIVLPCVRGLAKRGRPFRGILYPGIMVTADGPKVIEFNARFGDPETQSYMRILKTDLADILLACATGTLGNVAVEWSNQSACCAALASGGYPGAYEKGKVIHGLEDAESPGIEIFHAGTRRIGSDVVTNGGRVLCVTATGITIKKALLSAYQAISHVSFEGMQFRSDIGGKSL